MCRIKENIQKIRFMELINDKNSEIIINQLKKKNAKLKEMLKILKKHRNQDE